MIEVKAIYDNGGESLDCITVVTTIKHGRYYEMLGTDRWDGRTFSQWCEGENGRHLGKKVELADLPAPLQEHIKERLTEEQ